MWCLPMMHSAWCPIFGDKKQGRHPVTWASVGTSFPLGLTLPPAPEGRKWFVFCLKDMGLCQVQPCPETLTTIIQLPDQNREGREWGICSGTGGWCDCLLRLKPLHCDLEASWDSRAPPFDHSLLCERGKGTWPCSSIYFITDFMWVVPPCSNTMAAPDSAHSHTVLPHWKSHKTWVVQGSQTVRDIFWVFCFLKDYFTFAGFLPEDWMHFYQYTSVFFCNIFCRIKCDLTNCAHYYSSLKPT